MRQVLIAVAVVAMAASVAAVDLKHPNKDRGYIPDSMYGFNALDSVNEFNGNLAMTIPIGKQYPVAEGLSYGFSISYSSQVWDNIITEDPQDPQAFYTETVPARLSNAGLGWNISFGMLFGPGIPVNPGSESWLFVAQDGSQHHFYTDLHDDDVYEGAPPVNYFYTRDGSYLRMHIVSATFITIEHPNGLTYEMTKIDGTGYGEFRTTKVVDRFNNSMTIDYSTPCAIENIVCETWIVRDMHSREHTLEFYRELSDFGSGLPAYISRLKRVTLEAFNGQLAVYDFIYGEKSVRRPDHNVPETNWNATIDVLKQVSLPDTSSFQFVYKGCTGVCPQSTGALLKAVYPTGGVTEWEYGLYIFPGGNSICGSAVPAGKPPSYWNQFNTSIGSNDGVVVRELRNTANGTDALTWTYKTFDPQYPVGAGDHQVWREVTDPDGHVTKSYFATQVSRCETGWTGWDYGLPFDPEQTAPSGDTFLSKEYWDGPSNVSQNLRRRDYVRYVRDKLIPISAIPESDKRLPRWWYDSNRRVDMSESHYYASDGSGPTHQTFSSSDQFDGLGHHRYSASVASPGHSSPENMIISTEGFTTYNLNSGTYQINPDTNVPGPNHDWTPWDATEPWVLGTADQSIKTVYYGDGTHDTATTETFFDTQTGRLLRTRQYKNGLAQGPHDLVTVYGYSEDGNPAVVSRHGADRQTLQTNDPLDALMLPPVDSAEKTEYQYGVVQKSYPLALNDPSAPAPPLASNRDIDRSTGLPTAQRDVSGFETTFIYDELGRLVNVTPEDSRSAKFDLVYTPADVVGVPDETTDPSVNSKALVNLHSIAQTDSAVLARSETYYDGFGRKTKIRERMPTDQGEPLEWATQLTRLDARGRLTKQSTWVKDEEVLPSDIWTVHSDYDYAGRVGRVIGPGFLDLAFFPNNTPSSEVLFTYDGYRKVERVTRNVWVKEGSPATPAIAHVTYTNLFDGFGNVFRTTEQLGPGASDTVDTEYKRDVLGNLIEVSLSWDGLGQFRWFEYDHLGFLRREGIPEKNRSIRSGWDVDYYHYNTLGQAALVDDADHNFLNVHDVFGRLTEVWDRDQGKKLREFDFYDTNDDLALGRNPGVGWALNKLKSSRSWNYDDPSPAEPLMVRMEYTYDAAGGTVDTRLSGSGRGAAIETDFLSSYSFSPLGRIASVVYPTVVTPTPAPSWVGALAPPQRTVVYDYDYGWLSKVHDLQTLETYADTFDYYPSGTIKSVTLGDGVLDTVTIDETTYLPRPTSMGSSGAIATSRETGDWNSDLSYDGAGNIIEHGSDTQSYTNYYDRANRLVESTSGSNSESLTYDGFGNIYTRQDSLESNILLAVDPTTNRINNHAISYDNSGNIVNLGTVANIALTYDQFNKQIRLFSPTRDQYNYYDTGGERFIESVRVGGVEQSSSAILRDFGGSAIRRVEFSLGGDWVWEKDYIRMPGRVLQVDVHEPVGSITRRFFHVDHLGTPQIITNSSKHVRAQHEYLPFGTQVSHGSQDSSNSDEPMKFTGHKRDFFSNAISTTYDLDYMHARYYSPHLGRFLSVDPMVTGSVGSSQSWNRYSYVLNNPIVFTDPFGLLATKEDCKSKSCPATASEEEKEKERQKIRAMLAKREKAKKAWGKRQDAASWSLSGAVAQSVQRLPEYVKIILNTNSKSDSFGLGLIGWASGSISIPDGNYQSGRLGVSAQVGSGFSVEFQFPGYGFGLFPERINDISVMYGPISQSLYSSDHGFDLMKNPSSFTLGYAAGPIGVSHSFDFGALVTEFSSDFFFDY